MRTGTHYATGYDAGTATGSWVFDGNSTAETVKSVLQGFEDGDPEVMDMCPAPLSGEWAGESMVELLGDDYTDDDAEAYEQGFETGFWDEVQRSGKAML
jgi:hypothetical protein